MMRRRLRRIRHPPLRTISGGSWPHNFALAADEAAGHYAPVILLIPLLIQVAAAGQPPLAESLDSSFPAMKRSADVYCVGSTQGPCVVDQTASLNEIKAMLSDGRWPEQAIRQLMAEHTRAGEVNWVAVRLAAATTLGSPERDRLEAINSQALVQEENRKSRRRSTVECRTYATKRSARTTCTSY